MEKFDRILTIMAIVIGALVAITTSYGVYRFYSPIPYWDEWDGYIGFYINTLRGAGISNWLATHVDHRIAIPRMLFWLDLRFFRGNHVILFVAELLMLAGIVFIVAKAADRKSRPLAIGLGAALMLSWAQSETLTWGFETSLIGAFFFAVWSFYFFTRVQWSTTTRFVLAYIAAALAELSMGSGLAVPLVLAAATVLMRRPRREFVASVLIAAVMIALYFVDLNRGTGPQPEPQHGSHAWYVVKFFALVLGNPLSQAHFPIAICMVVGMLTLLCMLMLSVYVWFSKQITPYRTFLISVWLFAVASIAMITIGRSIGGLSQAILSRYTTGSLLAWFALALLAVDVLTPAPRRLITSVVVLLAGLTAISQQGVAADTSYLYARKLGVLSHKIGLDRVNYTIQLFPQASPWHERFVEYTRFAAEHNLAIYDRQWLRDAGVVQFSAENLETGCRGHVEHETREPDDQMTVSGWLLTNDPDALIVLTDEAGKTIGYGVTGARRTDVAEQFGREGTYSGWIGFARPTTGNVLAYRYRAGRFCAIQ